MTVPYRYRSLEDFLRSVPLTVDAQLDDGWGAAFPVKGRIVEAAILFADISRFSSRTMTLDPIATLIFVNNFFSWVTAEALLERPGVIDKYIGDEVMVVFAQEFGSADPLADAVRAAMRMCDHDVLSFQPHIGVAAGRVLVGYVGTPLMYGCSVFGTPVTLAARCAAVRGHVGYSLACPAADWGDRQLTDLFEGAAGTKLAKTQEHWKLRPPREVEMKNLPALQIREFVSNKLWLPQQSAEERATESLSEIRKAIANALRPSSG